MYDPVSGISSTILNFQSFYPVSDQGIELIPLTWFIRSVKVRILLRTKINIRNIKVSIAMQQLMVPSKFSASYKPCISSYLT